ncbi:MAG: hypothetical protein J7K22_01420 [Nanoarchaeota archaeon]|nr:hypothetical protein [Nanoarchaeota archaeon]
MVWKAVVIVIVLALIGLFLYINFISIKSVSVPDVECVSNLSCELSYCDCKCYPKGQTPEKLQGIVCGKNCEDWYNVTGCACINYSCVEVYK